MEKGDAYSVNIGIELPPWHFKRVVIIWHILLDISIIPVTLDYIFIFFNTLTTKGMSRNNSVTFYFEFFILRKYSENYCNWYSAEFSTVLAMKQDFEIGALGYHSQHLTVKFQINSYHNNELNYHFNKSCLLIDLKSTIKVSKTASTLRHYFERSQR